MYQIDLIHHRYNCQILIDRRIGVGHGLCLNALKGIDQQHGPFAAGQTPRNLVVKIDVAGGIDQVEFVKFAFVVVAHANGAGLNRDAPLPLQLHVVEHLLFELPFFNRPGAFQQTISQRALAVVDMGDDREVANVGRVNGHGRSVLQKRHAIFRPLEPLNPRLRPPFFARGGPDRQRQCSPLNPPSWRSRGLSRPLK